MGIYGALSSAVTGLRAQAHALENISGNIANSQTTGYKRIETDFLDLIPDAPLKRQVPGAVLAQSRGTNEVQGDIKTVSNETFVALNSNGFFVVEPKIGQSDGNSVFAGTNFYTRRGDFEIDKDGMLVNGAGYYLKGLPIDTTTGNISGSVPEVIKLSNAFLPAQETNRINYQSNLPQLPKTTAYNATVYNSELLEPNKYAGYAGASTAANMAGGALTGTDGAATVFNVGETVSLNVNGTAVTFEFTNGGAAATGNQAIDITTAPAQVATVLATMQASLRSAGGPAASSAIVDINGGNLRINLGTDYHAKFSVTGGTAAQLTALGLTNPSASTVPTRPAVTTIAASDDTLFKSNSVAGGAITVYASNGAPANVQMRWAKIDSAASGGSDTWNLFYMSDSAATGSSPMWTNTGQTYTFGADGSLVAPGVSTTTLNNLTINGVAIGNVELKHDTNGVSQFADVNGTVNVSTLNQNGYGAGEFVSVAINDSGRVVATYSNGERIDMAQVVTAEFNAINQLKRLDGGVFATTSESGEAILDLSGSGIIGGSLEASNTDISDEFTKLIVTQQAYAAGTRIVTAADKMLQEALNMIR
ncbi:flagellar hook-basal body complex protein [Devosia sp. J2-20]|jgi:flagellar hook protein FlgE|uniref:Flagellar hook protein FlgE n=1 Tax=Devosia litorisediminis TaxID=2829817 RepID=A0A942ICQ0_9HYPH|nr:MULTISPECIES: flagellar hook-basal body complex protein [Devosia]MBS3847884.1 flagellar hook-basal body complex protein [Devosia litorisediminis]MCZ4345864.1 flagellar hook-basal body complex protein [Devosia neptuniae]WDQ99005.1 flagellar hook-basal body complex protein [Devosia sp. J2-20]|tara:strand:- start:2387 stop:4159 length:1773 start_codon:yes stop_codon:yes gene_type:complete